MDNFAHRSGRTAYLRVSILCLLAAYGLPMLAFTLAPREVAAMVMVILTGGAVIYLAVRTFERLQDAGHSGWWALLILMGSSGGPVLYQAAPIYDSVTFKLTLGNLVILIPVLMGWFLPSQADQTGLAEA